MRRIIRTFVDTVPILKGDYGVSAVRLHARHSPGGY